MAVIEVQDLVKEYAATTAVDGISFEVGEKEVLGFLGPNGAGKTTTLRMLTGFLAPTSGRIRAAGYDVFTHPAQVKRAIGYLPENVPLYPEMRVEEYLCYRAGLKLVSRAKRPKLVAESLERCRLTDVRRRIIGQLSKGYRQRVGLADALVGDPQILVLDEPTIGLDPNQIRDVRDLVRELGRERTVILSSHILPEVEAVCSRVLIVSKGVLVGQGRPEELRARLGGGKTYLSLLVRDPLGNAAALLGAVPGVVQATTAAPRTDGLTALELEVGSDLAVRERLFDAAVQGGLKLLELSAKSASLEDVFVQITTAEAKDASAEPGGAA